MASKGALESAPSVNDMPYFQALVTVAVLSLVFFLLTGDRLYPGFPLVRINDKAPLNWSKARSEWNAHAFCLIKKGIEQVRGSFQVITAVGPRIILPNEYAEEIRNDPHLSFTAAIGKEFFFTYPGFEPFKILQEREVLQETVRIRLTQSLNYITEHLAEEATSVMCNVLGDSAEWKEIMFKPAMMDLVARVSSRVFIGTEACQNKEWLDIFKSYTTDSFVAARQLRTWHPMLRPIVHWFLPECRKIREEIKTARRIINPIIQARRDRNRKAGEAGQPISKISDAIGWMDESAKGRPFDIATGQLTLTVAATHTTSDLTMLCMFNLCAYPEYFAPLREEIVAVVGKQGWKKASLQQLKLMDSFIKETQRLQHGVKGALNRLATKPVKLSDGSIIPKGAYVMVGTEKAMNPTIFPAPDEFNGRRFLEMREQPGQENRWQLVTTSMEHLGFGHGRHACPGRFFAANEIKVLLVFLLMKYEWKFPDGQGMPDFSTFAMEKIPNFTAKLSFRRRKEEINL